MWPQKWPLFFILWGDETEIYSGGVHQNKSGSVKVYAEKIYFQCPNCGPFDILDESQKGMCQCVLPSCHLKLIALYVCLNGYFQMEIKYQLLCFFFSDIEISEGDTCKKKKTNIKIFRSGLQNVSRIYREWFLKVISNLITGRNNALQHVCMTCMARVLFCVFFFFFFLSFFLQLHSEAKLLLYGYITFTILLSS